MQIDGATAFVTGANRGFGRSLAAELLARGATVYAGARRPETVDLPGAIPVRIDVTDPESVAEAAATARSSLRSRSSAASTSRSRRAPGSR